MGKSQAPNSQANERWLALKGLLAVVQKHQTIDKVEQQQPFTPLARELLYGCCRCYFSLSELVGGQLKRPLRRKDHDLLALLVLGAYQLQHTRIPAHAAVDTSVALTDKLKKSWAKPLVNATLRNLARAQLRNSHDRVQQPANLTPATTDHPEWLIQRLTLEYGDLAAALMQANNHRAPMALRLNSCRQSIQASSRAIAAAGEAFDAGALPETLVLKHPCTASELPGYKQGHVSVQDAGAQLANACWPDGATGGRLLDACAAPGGKLHHALERLKPSEFVALEWQPQRLATLKAEAQRLGWQQHMASYRLADATNLDWWDGQPFDRVLLDAPCTGTGTLRRHPDIKLHLSAINGRADDELAAQVQKQRSLLENLWQVLAPGGELLYCTCSLLKAENDEVVGDFLTQHCDAKAVPLCLPSGFATKHGWQLTPLDPATDGFYYALLRRSKRSSSKSEHA